MNTRIITTRARGFTLIELLVVIAIIGILAGLLLPALGKVKTNARIRQARLEMAGIISAFKQYESHYTRLPVSKQAVDASSLTQSDFTFGATINMVTVHSGTGYNANNSEPVTILMDKDLGVNADHVKNPQRHVLLTPKVATANGSSGVGPDGVYRDPWGNPFIISVDLNFDDMCRDWFYSQRVDGQAVGLAPSANGFVLNGSVMIWSAGPDGRIENGNAKAGFNKDNVLSWTE